MKEHVVEENVVLASWSPASNGIACQIDLARDQWLADIDEPDHSHATPHEILDAALASCTTLTLELYVKRKGWSVSRIEVTVTHKQAADVYRLERRVSIEGDLTAEQRTALLRVALACPMHRTLTGDITVNTSIG